MHEKNWIEILVGVVVSVGLIVFAASPIVTWNDKLLFVLTDSSTLTHYWSIFRATGRIIWPVNYLIYIVVIVCNAKLWDSVLEKSRLQYRKTAVTAGTVTIAVCCFLQVFDISGRLVDLRKQFVKKNICFTFPRSSLGGTFRERKSETFGLGVK